jgi:sarcosine oxidase
VATKAGLDIGGDEVTPDSRRWEPNPRPYDKLVCFLEHTIPGSIGPVLFTRTCLYTMPPDRNLIVDRLPEHPGVIVLQGAAHGAKFAGVIGKIASQLATRGETEYPIDAFGASRLALTDPAFERAFVI